MNPPTIPGDLVIAPPGKLSYEFPFTALDPTPGGSNLGRIEWHVELVPTPGRQRQIGGFLVWATQTRDPRYDGRTFWMACETSGLQGRRAVGAHGSSSFIERVWYVAVCREHRRPVLSAYPENHHRRLRFELNSSIMVTAEFLP